jgi:hypothetical protein
VAREAKLADGRVELRVAQLDDRQRPAQLRAQLDEPHEEQILDERREPTQRGGDPGREDLVQLGRVDRRDPTGLKLSAQGREELRNALRMGRGALERVETVDEKALRAEPIDQLEDAPADGVERALDGRLPGQLHVASVIACGEVDPDAFGLGQHPLRRLIEGKEEPLFLGRRGRKEAVADDCLADAAGAQDHGGRPAAQSAAEHRVEPRDAEGQSVRAAIFPGSDRGGLETRKDADPLVADLERVQAPQIATAPELLHLQLPLRANAKHAIAQADQAIYHRMDGLDRALAARTTREQKERACPEPGLHLKLVYELLEFAIRFRGLPYGGEAVEDDQICALRPQLLTKEIEERPQASLLEHAEPAQVRKALGDRRSVEEGHVLQVLQEARVRLGEKGDVKDSLAVLRAVEADLVGEDRLAGPGGPFDDVDATGEEPGRGPGCRS